MPPKKRSRVTRIKDPTLFEMGKLEEAGTLANALKVERPYSEPGLFLGTSAFTAAGWPGSFYPVGMKPADYLKYYAANSKLSRSTQLITALRPVQRSRVGTRKLHQISSLLPKFLKSSLTKRFWRTASPSL